MTRRRRNSVTTRPPRPLPRGLAPFLTLAGRVWVDTATVAVGDPCYLPSVYRPERCECPDNLDGLVTIDPRDRYAAPVPTNSVEVHTGGDGVFPVFEIRDRAGEVVGLFVDFRDYEDPPPPQSIDEMLAEILDAGGAA